MEKVPTSPAPTYMSFDEKDPKRKAQVLTQDDGVDDLPPSYIAASGENTKGSLVLELSSKWSTLNSTYSLRSGQVLYRTDTSSSWCSPNVTTIEKIQPSSGSVDRFSTLARLSYKAFSPTRIEMDGQTQDIYSIMTKASPWSFSSWSRFGRDRVVTLPDGRRARWSLGCSVCILSLEDEASTPLAAFHRHRSGFFNKNNRRPASLEIFAAAFNPTSTNTEWKDGVLTSTQGRMLDFIFVTWLYVEKIRKEREEQAKRAARSGGGGP
ncbi:hypothetical protein DL96DRAFT_1503540 [Flagelloscypha sp. PMI_526]|nr:hypothetical protein DL96DRAFT_1503540 [Flagelloscypha sp. PMI_526]